MWGVISTTSLHLNGTAYGNVFDYSDGQIDNPTGRIFLFIDGLDYSPKDFKVNPFVSFTISEEVMGQGCSADPEDPTCSKITLTGQIAPVPQEDFNASMQMFESRHPAAKYWQLHADHDWVLYELHITNIFLLDYYGGAKNIPVQDYYNASLIVQLHPANATQTCAAALPKAKANPGSEALALSSATPQPLSSTNVGASLASARPWPLRYARFARWLVHGRTTPWGVLSTTSVHLEGTAFGNVQSHSDGPADKGTGRLFFYMTHLDASCTDIQRNPKASYTISENQMYCGGCFMDAEDPNCSKVILSGTMLPVTTNDMNLARAALFSRHPSMETWPKGHGWVMYELKIENIFLLNHYGPGQSVDVDEYFAVDCPTHDPRLTDAFKTVV